MNALHFTAILPTLMLVGLGIGLRRLMSFEEVFWNGLERLVYFVFFPVLLFDTTARADLSPEHATTMLLAVAILSVGIVLSYLGIRINHAPERTRHAIFQCGFRFNTYIGIAVLSTGFGAEAVGLFALMAAVGVPLANFAAISALSLGQSTSVWRELSRNPLVLGTMAGLLANLVGLHRPHFIDEVLLLFSKSAIVLGLIAVGSALQFESLKHYRRLNAYFLIVKLLILPTITIVALYFFTPTLSPLAATVAVLFSALPTASAAYILSRRLGGDGKTVAFQITMGSLFSLFTMPFWLMLCHHLFDS